MAHEIAVRYFDGCPNWQVARQRVGEALSRLDRTAHISLERVETPEQADRLDFPGSLTILIDGNDPFDAAQVRVSFLSRRRGLIENIAAGTTYGGHRSQQGGTEMADPGVLEVVLKGLAAGVVGTAAMTLSEKLEI